MKHLLKAFIMSMRKDVPPEWTLITRYSDILSRLRYGSDSHIRLHPSCYIDHRACLNRRGGEIEIDEKSCIMRYSQLLAQGGRITIGRHVTVNAFTYIGGAGNVTIGDYTRIAPYVGIFSFEHIYEDTDVKIALQGIRKAPVIIEEDVLSLIHI